LQAQKPEGGVRVGVGKLKVGVIPLGWRSRLQKTRKQHIFILKNWNRQKLRKKLDDALERMDNTTRKVS
jgi:hypothetical protein